MLLIDLGFHYPVAKNTADMPLKVMHAKHLWGAFLSFLLAHPQHHY